MTEMRLSIVDVYGLRDSFGVFGVVWESYTTQSIRLHKQSLWSGMYRGGVCIDHNEISIWPEKWFDAYLSSCSRVGAANNIFRSICC